MTTTRFFDVKGSARERGEQFGRAYSSGISAHVEALLECYRGRGSADPVAYLHEFLERTRFQEAIVRHMPHLLEEVRAIADASGHDYKLIYALQLMDEEWAYRTRRYGAQPLEKCSSFAITNADGGETWIGQNLDLGSYTDGFQTVVRHAPDDGRPRMLVFTTAGVICLLGVNEAGVGVCNNSLPQLPSRPEGVPVAFMLRRLLEASSAAEAGELCRSLPHATNQHYLIADSSRIISLECSAAGVTEYRPADPSRVLHANHPLAGEPVDENVEANSVGRQRSLERRLGQGNARLEDLQAALCAFDDPQHPVCRLKSDESGTINFTTGSMISRLRRGQQPVESWITFGPPSESQYQRFSF